MFSLIQYRFNNLNDLKMNRIKCIMQNCSGNGECLSQTNSNKYRKNPEISCIHNCKPVKCKNFKICGSIFPEIYIGCWGGKGCCRSCDCMFGEWNGGKGILNFNKNKEICGGCLDDKILVSLPKCDHTLCVECLKIVYYNNGGVLTKHCIIVKDKCPFCKK